MLPPWRRTAVGQPARGVTCHGAVRRGRRRLAPHTADLRRSAGGRMLGDERDPHMEVSAATFNLRTNVPQSWGRRLAAPGPARRRHDPAHQRADRRHPGSIVPDADRLAERLPEYRWVGQGRRGGTEDESPPSCIKPQTAQSKRSATSGSPIGRPISAASVGTASCRACVRGDPFGFLGRSTPIPGLQHPPGSRQRGGPRTGGAVDLRQDPPTAAGGATAVPAHGRPQFREGLPRSWAS